ncbi:unnamed protein product (macronuclear) [Paramecium tetraurelia]|uniref:Uncharacterized protein n=1 Tax=Paramecium tetraurelia TaxID=5888 RepID=A0CE23_PARTE|nr:uncharacterized protein GSPATT00007252001 [Paramecium tetraurelia]CAK69040.1 unnamed protein product [Paramecium tetraurelia]|eukprot:XP_001436437.1 hypothetical protein (macronuclear) [Paramecium tetraurelia strain d4-2]
MSSSTNKKGIKRRSKSFIQLPNHQISEQFKQRRKSCNCDSCGQLSSLQFKFMNLQSYISHLQTNKPKKYQSIESTYMDSQDGIIANNQIHKRIPQTIEVKLKYYPNPNTSLIQTNQFRYQKKQRSNSCCCDECGNMTKFQSQTKLIYIQQIIKNRHTNFRIKRNLDYIFKGISPIERKQEQEPEDDENYSTYPNQITSLRRSNLTLNQPTKQLQKGYQGSSRKVFLKDACKTTFFTKTNSNIRDLTLKSESNSPNVTKKKLNLPIVKSSYSKTTQITNEVQLFKFTPKLNSINLIS